MRPSDLTTRVFAAVLLMVPARAHSQAGSRYDLCAALPAQVGRRIAQRDPAPGGGLLRCAATYDDARPWTIEVELRDHGRPDDAWAVIGSLREHEAYLSTLDDIGTEAWRRLHSSFDGEYFVLYGRFMVTMALHRPANGSPGGSSGADTAFHRLAQRIVSSMRAFGLPADSAIQPPLVGARIQAPGGWQVAYGDGFQVIVQNPEDVSAKVPLGGRIQVRSSNIYNNPAAWALAALPAAGGKSVRIRENPARVYVGPERREAMQVDLEETRGTDVVAIRYVIVPLGGGQSVAIIMDAPAFKFATYQAAFITALQSATFAK